MSDNPVIYPEVLDYSLDALHAEYWVLRTAYGQGIINAQVEMVNKYGIPWDCINLITHPKKSQAECTGSAATSQGRSEYIDPSCRLHTKS